MSRLGASATNRVGEVHLRSPCVPRLRDHLGVGNSTIEVTVTVGVGAEQPGHVLSRHHHPERVTLHLGQVSHQPQERHRRRLDGTPRHRLGVETCALHLQGEALTAQRFDQRGALVAQRWSVLTRVVVRRLAVSGEHVGSSGRRHGRHHRRCPWRPTRGLTTPLGLRRAHKASDTDALYRWQACRAAENFACQPEDR